MPLPEPAVTQIYVAKWWQGTSKLAHLCRDKMVAIFQTTFKRSDLTLRRGYQNSNPNNGRRWQARSLTVVRYQVQYGADRYHKINFP